MRAYTTALIVFFSILFLISGIFIGSITGQVVRGELSYLGTRELAILFATGLTFIGIIISVVHRKRKGINILELIQEARREEE